MFGGFKGLERLKLEYNEITQEKCLKQIGGFIEIFNSNYFDWKVSFLGPKGTPYEKGYYYIEIEFDKDYPVSKPLCRFITRIWHPNVMTALGNISLKDIIVWTPNHSIFELILNIYILLVNPNFDDPINIESKNPNYEIIAREYNEKYAKKSQKIVTVCVDIVPTDQYIRINANLYETIRTVKEKVLEKLGSRKVLQFLFQGGVLQDDKTLEYYEFEDLDVISANISSNLEG